MLGLVAQEIPVDSTPRQTFIVALAGQECAVELWWAPQPRLWYFHLDVNGTRLLSGRQVSTRARLVRDSRFAGDLYVDTPGGAPGSEAPGRHGWGEGGHRLIYITAEENARIDPWI